VERIGGGVFIGFLFGFWVIPPKGGRGKPLPYFFFDKFWRKSPKFTKTEIPDVITTAIPTIQASFTKKYVRTHITKDNPSTTD